MIFVTMNQTTNLGQNGKTYHGGSVYEVPLTVAWRWIDRDIARYVGMRADVVAMPYYGMHVQQDGWRRTKAD